MSETRRKGCNCDECKKLKLELENMMGEAHIAREALRFLYTHPGVKDLLAPEESLGSIRAMVERVLDLETDWPELSLLHAWKNAVAGELNPITDVVDSDFWGKDLGDPQITAAFIRHLKKTRKAYADQAAHLRESLRHAIDALKTVQPRSCPHPENARQLIVFGDPSKWTCLECGHEEV